MEAGVKEQVLGPCDLGFRCQALDIADQKGIILDGYGSKGPPTICENSLLD